MTIKPKHSGHHVIVENFNESGEEIARLAMKDNSNSWKFKAGGVAMSHDAFSDQYVFSKDNKKTKKISGETYTNYTSSDAEDWLILARPNQKKRIEFWRKASQFLANHGFADLQEVGLKTKESLKY